MPRHTGDFTCLEYIAPDGSPMEYSEENIPYTPKHHLPIQLDGVNNGDYTMIFGFPGRTDRYLTFLNPTGFRTNKPYNCTD